MADAQGGQHTRPAVRQQVVRGVQVEEGETRRWGDPFKVAYRYAKQNDLVAIKFAQAARGTADVVEETIMSYGMCPAQADELAATTRVWTTRDGWWESCRFFIGRREAEASGLLEETRLHLVSGAKLQFWQQQLCGVVGVRLGWLAGVPRVENWQRILRETQGAKLTQQLVQHGVQQGIWQTAGTATCDLRYERVRTGVEGDNYFELAVYCADTNSRKEVVAAVQGWVQQFAGVELRGEGAFRRFLGTEEGKGIKQGMQSGQRTAAERRKVKDRLVMMFFLEEAATQEGLKADVEEVLREDFEMEGIEGELPGVVEFEPGV